jgi:hypothetical protein
VTTFDTSWNVTVTIEWRGYPVTISGERIAVEAIAAHVGDTDGSPIDPEPKDPGVYVTADGHVYSLDIDMKYGYVRRMWIPHGLDGDASFRRYGPRSPNCGDWGDWKDIPLRDTLEPLPKTPIGKRGKKLAHVIHIPTTSAKFYPHEWVWRSECSECNKFTSRRVVNYKTARRHAYEHNVTVHGAQLTSVSIR